MEVFERCRCKNIELKSSLIEASIGETVLVSFLLVFDIFGSVYGSCKANHRFSKVLHSRVAEAEQREN